MKEMFEERVGRSELDMGGKITNFLKRRLPGVMMNEVIGGTSGVPEWNDNIFEFRNQLRGLARNPDEQLNIVSMLINLNSIDPAEITDKELRIKSELARHVSRDSVLEAIYKEVVGLT